MKKILAILLSAAMVAGLSMPAMAETIDQTNLQSDMENKAAAKKNTKKKAFY